MIKIDHVETYGWEASVRGMRNPMNSWDKSDSYYGCDDVRCFECKYAPRCNEHFYHKQYHIGENDLALMKKLVRAGSDHRKFLRQIFVSVDITAPLYWWKEFDTYKVGTTANSTSTMHKIHAKAFERDDFSHDRLDEGGLALLDATVAYLEAERQKFIANKEDRQPWHNMIQMLPSSYNQMRTVTLNYENLINIYYARRNHKLAEWHTLCDWITSLPCAAEWICVKD